MPVAGKAMAVGLVTALMGICLPARPADPPARPLPENHGRVDAKLTLGSGKSQPLIFGFGGAKGGNLFASDFAKPAEEGYVANAYAFLAIGYFDAPGAPKELDRIALEGVHQAIATAARDPQVNGKCIAVMGGSKGGELALLLASHYPDIKAVVGLVPGNAVFMAHTSTGDTSGFSLDGKQLPFVPIPESAVPLPSMEMSDAVVQRLARHKFPFKVQHVVIDGSHNDVYAHPDLSEGFLKVNLLQESAAGCLRSR